MEKKSCPVDRGNLLICMEYCSDNTVSGCNPCSYKNDCICINHILKDALAYINYLEELLNAKADNPN